MTATIQSTRRPGMPEVLAPAGDLEKLKTSVAYGADAVYMSGKTFGLRTFSGNFTREEMIEGIEYAHAHGVVVEGELGVLAGVEDDVVAEHSSYTRPEEVEEFVARTGCDSLAIAIGTSHGAYKFKPGTNPQLRFDILEEIIAKLPGFPIVLHGSSSVPQEYVAMVNAFGGKMPNAIGVPESQLRKAAGMLARGAKAAAVIAPKDGGWNFFRLLC